MDIKYQFRNLEQVENIAKKSPGIFEKNMILAAKVATRDVQKTARAKHFFRSRTGHLEMAIETEVEAADQGVVGVVFINDNVAPYGKFVHTGTGPHWIRPKKKKALRWATAIATKGGTQISKRMYQNLRKEGYQNKNVSFAFAKGVWHPGTVPDPFLYDAATYSQKNINDIFNRYADRASLEVSR